VKTQYWVPTVVFLATSIPAVLLLQELQWGGEFKLWIAIVVGGLATAFAQSRLAKRENQQ
jgi:hypothetical protein